MPCCITFYVGTCARNNCGADSTALWFSTLKWESGRIHISIINLQIRWDKECICVGKEKNLKVSHLERFLFSIFTIRLFPQSQ